jgi:hypothetical protein
VARTRRVSPKRVASLQERYLRSLGATDAEIRRYRPVLTAQIGAESNFTQGIGSPAGAQDIAQFMPGTAPSYGVRLGDNKIKDDIRGQVRYMLPLLRKYGIEGALRGYNAGVGAIERSKGFSETNNYVSRVRGTAGQYGGLLDSGGGGGQQTPTRPGPTLLPPGLQIQPGPGTAGLLASLLQDQPETPPGGSLRPSPTAASPALPAGYQGIRSQGGPVPRRDIASLLEAISGAGTQLPGVTPGQVIGDAQNGGNPRTGRGQTSGKSAEGIINDLQGFVTGELGLPAGSRDRDRAGNARVGGSSTSDHLEEGGLFPGREALDILTTPAQGGWEQYGEVVRRFGLKPDKGGFTQGTVKVGKRRFRVQVIFGDEHDHGDHIHVGVRRA